MATVVTTTTTTATPPPAAGLARWTPSIPTNLMSMFNPFAVVNNNNNSNTNHDAPDADGAKAETEDSSGRVSRKRPAALGSVVGAGGPSRQSSLARSSTSTMFDEPDNRSTSEEGSVDDGKERLRRSLRPKSQYSICHAPPVSSTRQKLHRRPRALLQLHKLSSNARPRPAFEVIPSANFSVRLTRAITKLFTARHGLCTSDLVVLKAENYDNDEDEDEEEVRDVIGLICKGRKDDERTGGGKARIYLASGREWEARTTVNGAYEFNATDEHGLGLTVRWVPKRNKDGTRGPGKDGTRKFNFSTISPNSRRHPVIASLSATSLDISDTYRMPDPAAATPLSTPQHARSALADAMEDEGEKDLCETDDRLREIITLTSIWVAFREGWNPTFKPDDKDGLLTPASPTKSFSTLIGTPPTSPGPLTAEKRRSIQSISSGIIRRTSVLSKRNSSFSTTTADDDDGGGGGNHHTHDTQAHPAPSRSASLNSNPRTGRTRADSNSTVLVHRAASNRRKNQQKQRKTLADLLAAHDNLPEVSREELPTRDGSGGGGATAHHPSDKNGSRSPTPPTTTTTTATALRLSDLPAEKRGSTTTTTTTTTDTAGFLEPPTPRHPLSGKHDKRLRKSGSWRRLLCMASQDEM